MVGVERVVMDVEESESESRRAGGAGEELLPKWVKQSVWEFNLRCTCPINFLENSAEGLFSFSSTTWNSEYGPTSF